MTVTGTWLPSSPKTWVIPILRPMSPSLRAMTRLALSRDDQNGADPRRRGSAGRHATSSDELHEARGRSGPERTRLYVRSRDNRVRSAAKSIGVASELDLDVDAGGQVELHQRVHGLRRGIDNVEESLVGAHLELLARGLVDVWAPQHGPAIDDRRQQHWSRDAGARPAHGLHDLLDRPIKQLMIVGLQADADFLIGGPSAPVVLPDVREHAGPYRPPPLPVLQTQVLSHPPRPLQLHRSHSLATSPPPLPPPPHPPPPSS